MCAACGFGTSERGSFFCTTLALVVLCVIVYPRTYASDARLFGRVGTLALSQVGKHILTVPARICSILAGGSALVAGSESRLRRTDE
jgi:hypothetical protein